MERKSTLIASIAILACFAITWGVQGAILVNVGNIKSEGTQGGIVLITVSGSTTCFPIIEEAANIYMDNHSNYEIRVSAGGSSTGVKNAGEGISDIGMASRDIKPSENASYDYNLIDYKFASDGLAVIFDKDATHGVTNLTMQQLFLIYNGTYTYWDDGDLGGVSHISIDVVTRAEGSGTRSSFEELVTYDGEILGDNPGYISHVGGYTTYPDNPAVAVYVAGHPDSIGYCGLGFVDPAQHLDVSISVNGIDYYSSSVENVKSGVYPLSRFLHLVTLGLPNAGTQAFIDFIYGPTGQAIVAEEGFVTLY